MLVRTILNRYLMIMSSLLTLAALMNRQKALLLRPEWILPPFLTTSTFRV